jgi:hypothetical protein
MWRLKEAADYSAKSGGIQTHMVQGIAHSMGTLFHTVHGANAQQLGTDVKEAISPLFVNNNGGRQRVNDLINDLCSGRLHVGDQYVVGRAKEMNERYAADQAARLAAAQEARQSPRPNITANKENNFSRAESKIPELVVDKTPKSINATSRSIANYCLITENPDKDTIIIIMKNFMDSATTRWRSSPGTTAYSRAYDNTLNTIAFGTLQNLFNPIGANIVLPSERKETVLPILRAAFAEFIHGLNLDYDPMIPIDQKFSEYME